MSRWIAFLLLLLALPISALAADSRTVITSFSYAGCVDAAKKPVPAKADEQLAHFAEARLEDDKLVIYYNPKALPELLPETRLFLFAQECARFPLKQPLGAERSAEQIQAAECWALATLNRSRLLTAKDSIEALQVDLPAESDVWQQIGSPAHSLNLAACPRQGSRGSLALPSGGAESSDKWNACVQSCGSKLYACGRAAGCQSSYNACSSACDGK